MTMSYVFKMTCWHCKTAIQYETERPEWKTYDVRVEESNAAEKAAAFVAMHADDVIPRLDSAEESDAAIAWWNDAPSYVGISSDRRPELAIPHPHRYIDCPVCDVRIKEPNGSRFS